VSADAGFSATGSDFTSSYVSTAVAGGAILAIGVATGAGVLTG